MGSCFQKYEGCSESNAPTFFFLETIYAECMKFTHIITGFNVYGSVHRNNILVYNSN